MDTSKATGPAGTPATPPPVARQRVYEIARDAGVGNKELLQKIRALGIEVNNHMSVLDPEDVVRVRRALDKERQESLIEERIGPTVIRRRSKNAPPAPRPARPAIVPAEEPEPLAARAQRAEEPEPYEEEPVVSEPVAEAEDFEPREPAEEPIEHAEPAPPPAPEPAVAEPPVAAEPEPEPEPAPAPAPPPPVVEERPAPPPPPPLPQPIILEIPVREQPQIPLPPKPVEAPPMAASPYLTPSGPNGPRVIELPLPRIQIEDRGASTWSTPGRTRELVTQRDLQQRAGGQFARKPQALKPAQKKRMAAGKKAKKTEITTPAQHKRIIKMDETVAVTELARQMGIKATEVLKKLWGMGMTGVNINQNVDADTAALLAGEFGYEVESRAFKEEAVLAETEDRDEDLESRAPVITVMGHVDHGKTSLLDAIRHTDVAAGEAGGITQHIGAYKVHVERGDVVFLDTPGHEAFTAMRARGAQATDIVVLVVAADDGMMPQTVEAINHAKDAGVPIIVAVNKIDKPNAQPERIRQQLSDHGLVPESWGGETIYVDVSARTKVGVDALLEMIALQAEVLDFKANPKKLAKGLIIEARLDRNRGPMATVLVQEGTLRVGDQVVTGEHLGKVRAMLDDKGRAVSEAGPSMPVELLGLDGVPEAGDYLNAVSDEKSAKALVQHRYDSRRKKELGASGARGVSLENILEQIQAGSVKELKIVLKADVQGSVEAVRDALSNLSGEQVKVNVISAGVGGITETDVNLAKAGGAIIIGFHVRPAGKATQLAEQEHVDIRLYDIIYEALDEVKKAMAGMLAPVLREKIVGRLEVRQTFSISKVGTIAGCFVTEGKVTRQSSVRLVRDSVPVFTGKLAALKRFKDDVREVEKGYECGVSFEGFNDIKDGDVIEAFEMEQFAPVLT
ncbi:MAG TPA: translation initiation factor IF-2 [Polyangia bacterium]